MAWCWRPYLSTLSQHCIFSLLILGEFLVSVVLFRRSVEARRRVSQTARSRYPDLFASLDRWAAPGKFSEIRAGIRRYRDDLALRSSDDSELRRLLLQDRRSIWLLRLWDLVIIVTAIGTFDLNMLWFWIPVSVIAVLIFLWFVKRGAPYTTETIHAAIASLLKRGLDGGFLIIRISLSSRFIQFRKYIRSPGDYGIEFSFPKAQWSRDYFGQVAALCDFRLQEYVIKEELYESSMTFLYADFGKDDKAATEFAKAVLMDVFEVTSLQSLFCELGNASVEDVLVDR